MSRINIGCNILIVKDNKILLGKRKNCFGAGTWGLPGGHLHFGENLIDAAIRELKEETGIESKNLTLVSVVEGSKSIEHYIQINFLLNDFKGEPKVIEPDYCEVWEYYYLDKLPSKIFPPHSGILQAFIKNKFYHL